MAAFLVILFTIAYLVTALPVLADHGVIPGRWLPQALGMDAERFASVLLIVVAVMPTTVLVTWAAEGPHGIRSLLRPDGAVAFTTWWGAGAFAGGFKAPRRDKSLERNNKVGGAFRSSRNR